MALIFDADSLAYFAAAGAENRVYEVVGFDENGDPAAHTRVKYKDEAVEYGLQFASHDIEKVSEPSPPHFAFHTVNMCITKLREATLKWSGEDEFFLLTGADNFRHGIATIQGYKANRTQPKPALLPDCREFLVGRHHAIVIDGREADDECSILAHKRRAEGHTGDVIISIDKDLDMIPGLHYNWQRETYYEISPLQGLRFFYKQCLMGDAGDNIPGCPGIGKENKLLDELDGMRDEVEMYHFVLSQYAARKGSRFDKAPPEMTPEEALLENARLLWMQTEVGQLWVPPTHTDKQGNRLWGRLEEF